MLQWLKTERFAQDTEPKTMVYHWINLPISCTKGLNGIACVQNGKFWHTGGVGLDQFSNTQVRLTTCSDNAYSFACRVFFIGSI